MYGANNMKYREAKWIINEVESLIEAYESNTGAGIARYRGVIPDDNIYPTTLNRMTFDEVAEIVNSHYGVYQENDVITDRIGIPCLITHIDCSNAETLHEVKYHVLYQGGITNVLFIDDILEKIGHYEHVMKMCNHILSEYFDNEIYSCKKDEENIKDKK